MTTGVAFRLPPTGGDFRRQTKREICSDKIMLPEVTGGIGCHCKSSYALYAVERRGARARNQKGTWNGNERHGILATNLTTRSTCTCRGTRRTDKEKVIEAPVIRMRMEGLCRAEFGGCARARPYHCAENNQSRSQAHCRVDFLILSGLILSVVGMAGQKQVQQKNEAL